MKAIAIVLCLLVAGGCFADDFTVYVNTIIGYGINEELAESLIRRELRSLGDVEVTDTPFGEANWFLDIAIVQSSNLHIGFLSIWYRPSRALDLTQRWLNGDFDDDDDMSAAAGLLALAFSPWNTSWTVRNELRDLVELLILNFDDKLDDYRPGGKLYQPKEGE